MTQLVEVIWEDIVQDASWNTDCDCLTVTSVGYLKENSDRYLKIGGSLTETGEVAGILAIPKGCVMKIKFLSRAATQTEEVSNEHRDPSTNNL